MTICRNSIKSNSPTRVSAISTNTSLNRAAENIAIAGNLRNRREKHPSWVTSEKATSTVRFVGFLRK